MIPMVPIATLQLQSAPAVSVTKPVDWHAPTADVHPDQGCFKVNTHNMDSVGSIPTASPCRSTARVQHKTLKQTKIILPSRFKPQIKIRQILLKLRWAQIFLGAPKMQLQFICTFCNLPDDFVLVKGNQKVVEPQGTLLSLSHWGEMKGQRKWLKEMEYWKFIFYSC